MQDIIKLLAKYSSFFVFLILEFLCFYLIVQNNDHQRDIFVNSSNMFSGKVLDRFDHFKRLFQMERVMDSVQAENARLRQQLSQSKYYYQTATQEVVDSSSMQRYQYIPAKIINNSVTLRNNIITIDKGYLEGVEKGMGIIEAKGVVGIVRKVGRHFSIVNPLLNERTSISVAIKNKNYPGSLVWDGFDPRYMSLEGVPKHIPVIAGDSVITSGFSLFPRDLLVGTVSEVNLEPGNNSLDIEVKLNNDLGQSYGVMVVKDLMRLEQDSIQTSILDGQ